MPMRRDDQPVRMRAVRLLLLGFALTACAIACAGDDLADRPQDPLLADAPSWVLVDCSRHWNEPPGTRLCGVGSVAGTRNLSLARTAAIGRARSQVTLKLEPMVEAMLRDYSETAATDQDDGATPLSAQQIENVTTQITQFTSLNGTTMKDTWVAPDGTLYTLVDLDVEHFVSALDQMSSLTDAIRTGVRERAAGAFRSASEAATSAQSTQ
jgi:hypothetical protein